MGDTRMEPCASPSRLPMEYNRGKVHNVWVCGGNGFGCVGCVGGQLQGLDPQLVRGVRGSMGSAVAWKIIPKCGDTHVLWCVKDCSWLQEHDEEYPGLFLRQWRPNFELTVQ